MDAIDILGSILGGGAPGGQGRTGGSGGNILRDILEAGRRASSQSQRGTPGTPGSPPSSTDISRDAKELEDLLGVAKERGTTASPPAPPASAPGFPDLSRTSPPRRPRQLERPTVEDYDYRQDTPRQNEEAILLIRAMVNAAKVDGRVTREEQHAILQQIEGNSRQAADFLRAEFDRPLDVRDFAWSVPPGMEQKVYTLSLAAIDLDNQAEAEYLRDLAHGLRIPAAVRDEIHRRTGARALG
jgi:hypothetical protein